jgi:hypothetical protein
MTPDERQLITGLFDRMRANGPVDKDREADSLINQAVRQTPDAAYLLVQSVLAQDHYLQQAGARIEELEGRMRDLEDEIARMQQQAQPAQQQRGGGSFLGGLFGSKPQPAARSAGSVPSLGAGRGAAPAPGQPGSPWGQQPQRGGYAPQTGGFGQQQPMQQQAAQGPGFMRSALTMAAGVAGGMLAANAIQGMLSGNNSANAAGHSSPPSSEPSPFAIDNDADRQRAIDEQQDLAQDAELANEQHAALDDSADWGGADDSEY